MHSLFYCYSKLMKLYKIFFILVFITTVLNGEQKRPAIGLALSGGGALGFAHLGILEKIDSLDIPIDYIAGTSMGGLVGALYASGYSSAKILDFIKKTDWQRLLSDKQPRSKLPYFEKIAVHKYQFKIGISKEIKPDKLGLIEGQNIELLFNQLTQQVSTEKDFDKLPIPFRCISVDILSGNEVIMKDGSLAKAMRSTMSVPSIFSPVVEGDSLLIDGGILNNMPVNVVREMGADHVLAVSVRNPNKEKENLRGFLDILVQAYNIIGLKQIHNSAQSADDYIECMIKNYSPMDFSADKAMEIVKTGRKYAKENMDILLKMKEMAGSSALPSQGLFSIDTISVYNNLSYRDNHIKSILDLPKGKISEDRLVSQLKRVKDSLRLKEIGYDLQKNYDNQSHLIVKITEKTPKIFGVYIHGNKIHSFGFIYRLLGIRPGTKLDTKLLEQRISYLYSLGYFKKITYDLDFAVPGYIKLNINVKENPKRTIRFGLHYDNYYEIVAAVSGQFNNFLIPGLRIEDEFQFFGYTNMSAKMYYPSRSLDIPVYPFIEANFSSKPHIIYDFQGNRLAKFKKNNLNASAGLGLLYKNFEHISAYLKHEKIIAEPDIAINSFNDYREEITAVGVDYNLDLLDRYFLPKKGIYSEGFFEKAGNFLLPTDRNYWRYRATFDLYYTFDDMVTTHLQGYHSASNNAPEYKYFWLGGPDNFIGVDYYQLLVKSLSYIKSELKFDLYENMRLSFIYNQTLSFTPISAESFTDYNKTLSAFGASIEYNTPLGPIKLTVARPIQTISENLKNSHYLYLTAGYSF